jgi:hypothetical protein
VWIRQSHDGPRLLIRCVLPVASFNGVPFHGIKSNSTPCYFGPFMFFSFVNKLPTKVELLLFPLLPWRVSCLLAQERFTDTHSMSWPWNTRSSQRSIFPEFSSFHQYSWKEDPKGRVQLVMMQHVNLFNREDHSELMKIVEDLCNPFPLFLPSNLGVEILVRWVEL